MECEHVVELFVVGGKKCSGEVKQKGVCHATKRICYYKAKSCKLNISTNIENAMSYKK